MEVLNTLIDTVHVEFSCVDNSTIDWKNLPKTLDPERAKLLTPLSIRKRCHLGFVIGLGRRIIQNLLDPIVVDFCAGDGVLGLLLAAYFPHSKVFCVEKSCINAAYIERTAVHMGLYNVTVFCGDVADFDESFDLGVGLHVCGPSFDRVLHRCVNFNRAFVISGCCPASCLDDETDMIHMGEYGDSMNLPRSLALKRCGVTAKNIVSLSRLADPNVPGCLDVSVKRQAASILAFDRAEYAKERKFSTYLYDMTSVHRGSYENHTERPETQVIVGLPPSLSKNMEL